MSYHDLHPSHLQDLRAEPELLILDMRDPASCAQGRMDGAEPVSDALLRQLMKSRQRERPVLVYCYLGNSSRDLCQFVAGVGDTRVYNLVGGWQDWLQSPKPKRTPRVHLRQTCQSGLWIAASSPTACTPASTTACRP